MNQHDADAWDAAQPDPRQPRPQAKVTTETLSDGSIVFNVIYKGRVVAEPATLAEAEEIAKGFNTGIHIW